MVSDAPQLFISYRRADSAGPARRLHADLVAAYGEENVFIDVAGIEPGEDFVDRLDEAVTAAETMLVVIGPAWLGAAHPDGRRRLDEHGDHVRREILTALARGIRVVPLLVDGAVMPAAAELPAPLAPLATRNAVHAAEHTWSNDVGTLMAKLDEWHRAILPRTLSILCSGLTSGTDLGEHLGAEDVVRVLTGVNAELELCIR